MAHMKRKGWLFLINGVVLGLLIAVGAHAGVAPQKVTLIAKEFSYTPDKITVKAGRPVQILLDNKGLIEHDFVLDQFKVRTNLIKPGKSGSVTFTPKVKGKFEFYCSVPGHKEAGMKGTLVVE